MAFYTSIKISNASVAVACLGFGSIFAAIIEPIVMRRPHERLEILLGILAVPGVVLIVGGVPLEMRLGIAAGIVAALLSAIFTTLNKRFGSNGDPFAITCLEMSAGAVLLSVPAFFSGLTMPSQMDAIWLYGVSHSVHLASICDGFNLFKYVSAFSTLLILNLEPVYAIVLAAALFQEYEEPDTFFYGGTAIVLLTVVLQPQLRRLSYFKVAR